MKMKYKAAVYAGVFGPIIASALIVGHYSDGDITRDVPAVGTLLTFISVFVGLALLCYGFDGLNKKQIL